LSINCALEPKQIFIMKKILLFFFIAAQINAKQSFAQCSTNLLSNPSFETPVQTLLGNNLTGSFTLGSWTMTGGAFNVIKTNGTAYSGGPDNAYEGTQYVDITSAAGTLYQDFTLSGGSTAVAFSGYFSSREQSAMYSNWTASINIVDLGTNTVVATSSTRAFTNADGASGTTQEIWYNLFGNTVLPAGNYRYLVNLGNYGNFDAAFLAQDCILANGITNFTGSLVNKKNVLKWIVENQTSVASFEIESSTNGVSYNKVGNVNANSNSNQFSFIDDNTANISKLYYRLKIIYVDGSYKYSSIVIITGKELVLSIVPNPIYDNVTVSGLSKEDGIISIINEAGQLVLNRTVKEIQSINLNVESLVKGNYFIVYKTNQQKTIKKVVKL
jgi:hypothetical protein